MPKKQKEIHSSVISAPKQIIWSKTMDDGIILFIRARNIIPKLTLLMQQPHRNIQACCELDWDANVIKWFWYTGEGIRDTVMAEIPEIKKALHIAYVLLI